MQAKNLQEFKECWIEEFDHMGYLASSLPSKEALNYLQELKELRAKYLQKAIEHTYNQHKQLCKKYNIPIDGECHVFCDDGKTCKKIDMKSLREE